VYFRFVGRFISFIFIMFDFDLQVSGCQKYIFFIIKPGQGHFFGLATVVTEQG